MKIELYNENNKSKRDAINKVTRRRFRDKRSETRATAGGAVLPPLEKNVVQLVACGDGSSLGLSVADYNVSLIITKNHGANCPNSITNCYAQTEVHELGHQFYVGNVPTINPPHEDLSPPPVVANHMGTQPCEMQYAGFDDIGDVKFDLDCINEIRNLKDKH